MKNPNFAKASLGRQESRIKNRGFGIFLIFFSLLVFVLQPTAVFGETYDECLDNANKQFDACKTEVRPETTPGGRTIVQPGGVTSAECYQFYTEDLKKCEPPGTPTPRAPGGPAAEPPATFGGAKGTFEKTGEAAYGSKAKVPEGSLEKRVATILNAFLSILGIAFLILTSYGGLIWINARGDEAQAEKARNIITRAVFGLIIIAAAYALTAFIFRFLNR